MGRNAALTEPAAKHIRGVDMPKDIPDDPIDRSVGKTPAPKRRTAEPPDDKATVAKPRAKKPASTAAATEGPAVKKSAATAKKSAATVKKSAAKESTAKEKPTRGSGTEKATARPTASTKTPAPTERPAPESADRPAPEPASTPAASATQVADNPLHKRLGLRPGAAGVVVAPPENDDNPLLPLPEGFVMLADIDALAPLTGPFEYLQVFARDRGELASAFGLLRDKLAPNGSLWVSWMKQAGRGMTGDLNENIIRRLALTHGMVDVKIAALNRNWAALRLIHRRR